MRIKTIALSGVLILAVLFVASSFSENEEPKKFYFSKINGVNFVAPINPLNAQNLESLKRINAKWIAVIPYAYTRKEESKVIFFHKHPHWWGEGVEGAIETIRLSQEAGLKVMLKPQVWVVNDGWPGDFEPADEASWRVWENDYTKYALTYARICDSMNVDLYCIATEYRKAVQRRPEYWKELIKKIRLIYKGPITYAANWDNYMNVSFWDKLDFIGIDAYFPLSEEKTPEVDQLMASWKEELRNIKNFSVNINRKVLFTEYGYRSIDYAAHKQWETSKVAHVNLRAQTNSYQALYSSVWNESWMAGGFLWKWFGNDHEAGGIEDVNFTPQNKPAEEVIKEWYGK